MVSQSVVRLNHGVDFSHSSIKRDGYVLLRNPTVGMIWPPGEGVDGIGP